MTEPVGRFSLGSALQLTAQSAVLSTEQEDVIFDGDYGKQQQPQEKEQEQL